MPVIQYPYNLEVQTKTESVFDENTGEWSVGEETWVFHSKCRDEGGNGSRITTQDGEVYAYGSLIQLPKGTDGIRGGDHVRVTDSEGNVRVQGRTQKFSKDQLHSRLWL